MVARQQRERPRLSRPHREDRASSRPQGGASPPGEPSNWESRLPGGVSALPRIHIPTACKTSISQNPARTRRRRSGRVRADMRPETRDLPGRHETLRPPAGGPRPVAAAKVSMSPQVSGLGSQVLPLRAKLQFPKFPLVLGAGIRYTIPVLPLKRRDNR